MALDPTKNFAKVTPTTGYDNTATGISLSSGDGNKLPQPSTDGAFNLVWFNNTDYSNPGDDPNVEIVRVTARSGDAITITRAQEGTTATAKNLAGKTYKMILAVTAKTIFDANLENNTTPKLGGDLDLNDKKIINTGAVGNVTVTLSGNDGGKAFVVGSGSYDNIIEIDSAAVVSLMATELALNDTPINRAITFQFSLEWNNGNSGATETIGWDNGQKQRSTLTANCAYTFIAPYGVGTSQLKIIQGGAGGYTVTWPTGIKWAGGVAPVLSTAVGAEDILVFYWDGTSYYGQASIGFKTV